MQLSKLHQDRRKNGRKIRLKHCEYNNNEYKWSDESLEMPLANGGIQMVCTSLHESFTKITKVHRTTSWSNGKLKFSLI